MSLLVWFWLYVGLAFVIDGLRERRDRKRRP